MNGYRAFCFGLHGTRIPDVPTGDLEARWSFSSTGATPRIAIAALAIPTIDADRHGSVNSYAITSAAGVVTAVSNDRSGRIRNAKPAPSSKRQSEPANGRVQLPVRSIR